MKKYGGRVLPPVDVSRSSFFPFYENSSIHLPDNERTLPSFTPTRLRLRRVLISATDFPNLGSMGHALPVM